MDLDILIKKTTSIPHSKRAYPHWNRINQEVRMIDTILRKRILSKQTSLFEIGFNKEQSTSFLTRFSKILTTLIENNNDSLFFFPLFGSTILLESLPQKTQNKANIISHKIRSSAGMQTGSSLLHPSVFPSDILLNKPLIIVDDVIDSGRLFSSILRARMGEDKGENIQDQIQKTKTYLLPLYSKNKHLSEKLFSSVMMKRGDFFSTYLGALKTTVQLPSHHWILGGSGTMKSGLFDSEIHGSDLIESIDISDEFHAIKKYAQYFHLRFASTIPEVIYYQGKTSKQFFGLIKNILREGS